MLKRIEKQWENLKHHSKLATKLVSVSNSGFTTTSLNNLEEESNEQSYKKELEQLSSAHKEFLKTYDISQEQIENSLKKMKISLIKVCSEQFSIHSIIYKTL
jgi:transposase